MCGRDEGVHRALMVKRGCCPSTLEVGLLLYEPNRSGGIMLRKPLLVGESLLLFCLLSGDILV